jgi:hypothetical protein
MHVSHRPSGVLVPQPEPAAHGNPGPQLAGEPPTGPAPASVVGAPGPVVLASGTPPPVVGPVVPPQLPLVVSAPAAHWGAPASMPPLPGGDVVVEPLPPQLVHWNVPSAPHEQHIDTPVAFDPPDEPDEGVSELSAPVFDGAPELVGAPASSAGGGVEVPLPVDVPLPAFVIVADASAAPDEPPDLSPAGADVPPSVALFEPPVIEPPIVEPPVVGVEPPPYEHDAPDAHEAPGLHDFDALAPPSSPTKPDEKCMTSAEIVDPVTSLAIGS